MSRPADFIDAHKRHWLDAELLFQNKRWANASQLHGFSAECGLKAVMQQHLGMHVDAQGKPADAKYRKHVQEIWPLFPALATGRPGRRFLRHLPSHNPFSNWSHHDRYAASAGFRQSSGTAHRTGAESVHRMLQLEMAGVP